ncbi:hypothetical protein [Candidatus Thiosymbion oneisti]|uniref:hypothetical protein n=1 Tax=Candidatus Thiosymbion oneisti TaxID=589554 RepID=UPI00114CFD6D|nr:hypothetical protein [Candidatus Thiosymbion oneisti]
MVVRPDMREYQLLDHLLELIYIPLKELGLSNREVRLKSREELRALPLCASGLPFRYPNQTP